jgi:hypothetical protein
MGVIVLEGLVVTLLVIVGFREAVMNAVPLALKKAIGAGIGLFILFIGFVGGGFIATPQGGVPIVAPVFPTTAFRSSSGSTRLRSAWASSVLSHFGRKRTGAAVSAGGTGARGRSSSSRLFSSRKRRSGSSASSASAKSTMRSPDQAAMSARVPGPKAAR